MLESMLYIDLDPSTEAHEMPTLAMPTRRDDGRTLFLTYVVALAVALVGNLLIRMGALEQWVPTEGQLALAVAASLPLVAAGVLFWRLLRRDLDEMLQRIVLEGLGFALTVYIPLAALYVNLKSAGFGIRRLDAPDLLLTPALLVGLGIMLSARRYR